MADDLDIVMDGGPRMSRASLVRAPLMPHPVEYMRISDLVRDKATGAERSLIRDKLSRAIAAKGLRAGTSGAPVA